MFREHILKKSYLESVLNKIWYAGPKLYQNILSISLVIKKVAYKERIRPQYARKVKETIKKICKQLFTDHPNTAIGDMKEKKEK